MLKILRSLSRAYEGAVAKSATMRLIDRSMDTVGNAFNAAAKAVKTESGYWLDDLGLRGGKIEQIVDTFLPHVNELTGTLRQANIGKPTTAVTSNTAPQPYVYEYAVRCPGGMNAAQQLIQRDGVGALAGIGIQHVDADHYVISVHRAPRAVSETAPGEACYHTAKHMIDFLDSIGAQRVTHTPHTAAAAVQQDEQLSVIQREASVTPFPFTASTTAVETGIRPRSAARRAVSSLLARPF